jgi:hypothetical protein
MIVAALLVLLGILLIASNPLLGLIPGLVLVALGIVIGVLAMLGRGLGTIIGLGRRR